jgi:hypothetical protein
VPHRGCTELLRRFRFGGNAHEDPFSGSITPPAGQTLMALYRRLSVPPRCRLLRSRYPVAAVVHPLGITVRVLG